MDKVSLDDESVERVAQRVVALITEPPHPKRFCLRCGVAFVPAHGKQRHCTPEHAHQAAQENYSRKKRKATP